MLQDIRKNVQGTTAKIVVGLIVVSFAFFGIESILVNGGGNEIAEVNGESIYPQELQQALDTQKRRLIAMMGANLDPTLLDDERLKPQVLAALISQKLEIQAASKLNLAVSENEIGQVVGSMDQFKVDGAFSPEAYKSVLANAGYTPGFFKQSLHDELLVNQLRSGLAGSDFATLFELDLNAEVISEQRDLRYFTIPRESFSLDSAISEEQISEYYKAHQDNFRTPESVDVDYLELSLDDFRQPVEEGAILEAYEQAKQEAQYQTQNRVSHILFESGDEQDLEPRLAKAQEKLAAGVPFADVAKEFSDDVGSAEKGGDLGYTSGDTFPKEMESAISKLQPGVVSGPVKTDAGTHLILVTERKETNIPSLEEMREQLIDKIQREDARVALVRTVESLKDLAFNAEDLSYPAKELNLSVQQQNAVTRTQNEGLFSNPALLEALFSDDVFSAGNNSDVIELAGDKFVVLRVRNHNAPEVKPLESIRQEVVSAIVEENTRNAVSAEAVDALKQVRAGEALARIAEAKGYAMQVELAVDRRNSAVPPEVIQRAFELPTPAGDATSSDFIITPNGDAVVIELVRVIPGSYKSLDEPEKLQLQKLLVTESGQLIDGEFQRGLQESADISVLQ
ncbi:MAG: SurA N-terminal domain-containing protein [Halioglobus sp.]